MKTRFRQPITSLDSALVIRDSYKRILFCSLIKNLALELPEFVYNVNIFVRNFMYSIEKLIF